MSTISEAIKNLDAVSVDDIELAHIKADRILLAASDPAVREAYERVQARARDWWFA